MNLSLIRNMDVKLSKMVKRTQDESVRNACTFEAVRSQLGGRLREAGLIPEAVHGPDSQQASAALHLGNRHGVTHAAVGQPAVVTLVQTLTPGRVQLPRRRQDGAPPLALLPRLLERHLTGHRGEVHLAWNRELT